MSIRDQTAAELERRAALLPDELAEWKTLTSQNVGGLGIHTSQVEAITDFFEARIELHGEMVQELADAADDDELAYIRSDLESELGGAYGLMAVFRHILAQRRDTDRYRDELNAADLVAADCYRPCIGSAVNWNVLKQGQFRVPPLTFLNARSSPQALTRGRTFKSFGFDLEGAEKQLPLPFSFVSLRYHDTSSLWSYCTIHHEVGHLLDQDLGLADELGQLLAADPGPGIDPSRSVQWGLWLKESIADAFGVLLGGAGFVYTLADMLLLPASEVAEMPPDDHPPPYLRISLLGALLRRTLIPGVDAIATEIEANWQRIYGDPPPLQAPYLGDCPAMAKLLISTHLVRLRNHRLRDFQPGLNQDHQAATGLAHHLLGEGSAPDAVTFPMRLVPAAARLAVRGVDEQYASGYAGIHERALAFVDAIPHDEVMAPGGLKAEQKKYLRDLARSARFATPKR